MNGPNSPVDSGTYQNLWDAYAGPVGNQSTSPVRDVAYRAVTPPSNGVDGSAHNADCTQVSCPQPLRGRVVAHSAANCEDRSCHPPALSSNYCSVIDTSSSRGGGGWWSSWFVRSASTEELAGADSVNDGPIVISARVRWTPVDERNDGTDD